MRPMRMSAGFLSAGGFRVNRVAHRRKGRRMVQRAGRGLLERDRNKPITAQTSCRGYRAPRFQSEVRNSLTAWVAAAWAWAS